VCSWVLVKKKSIVTTAPQTTQKVTNFSQCFANTLHFLDVVRSRDCLPPAEPPPCVSTSCAADMDSSPRRWVLKPLSPLLQPSDLRTIAGPAPSPDDRDSGSLVVLQENDRTQNGQVEVHLVTVLHGGNSSSDEWQPSSPGSSSGSQCGFYSFVEDPASPEAELNKAWMVSPQRQSQLAILKKEKGFKLQTYSSNKKPESLFTESNGDSQYRVNPNNGIRMMDEDEEKQFRKMIIHSQAPKRSQTEPQTQGETLDPILSTDRLIEGFSLSFSPVSSRPEPPCPSEPGTVVKEQINFGAARQKFLQMEQDQLAVMLSSVRSPRTQMNLTPELDPDVYVSKKVKIYGTMDASNDTTPFKPAEKDETDLQRKVKVFGSKSSLSRESSVFEEMDSGHEVLSLEMAGGYTSDDGQLGDTCQDHLSKSKVVHETPIEREIRLTQEREEELRRSRGLKHSSGRGEMVRIKTRYSQLSLTPDTTFRKNQGSFNIHTKIQRENLREEGLQQPEESQEPDSRDPPPQLEDKCREADRQDENMTGDEPDSGTEDVFLSPCCPHRHPDESWFSQTNQATSLFSSFTSRDSNGRRQTAFSPSPPASLTPTALRETELPQSWRKNLGSTGLQPRGQGAPDFIEKEIEEALKRELELRELRESMKETSKPIFSPTPLVEQASKIAIRQFYPPVKTDSGVMLVRLSLSRDKTRWLLINSVSFITAKPWISSPSLDSSPAAVRTVPLVPRGLTETLLQDFEEHRAKMKLEESAVSFLL
ncbi:hypothetical protein GOODEAATRI_017009, partial [Goodea atripinnis]